MVTTALASANLSGGGENGGTAEAVADQDRRRPPGLAQMIGGVNEVGDIRRKGRIGKVALAGT